MNIIWLCDFYFEDKSSKYYPFMEIIEYLKLKSVKSSIVPIILYPINYDNSRSFEYCYFIRKKRYNNKNQTRSWITLLKILFKGYPIFLFKNLIRLRKKNTVIHLFSGFLPALFGSLIAKILRIPCILGPNVLPSKNLLLSNIISKNNIIYYIRDLIISKLFYHKILCFSQYHKYLLVKKYHIKPRNIEIINIGINSEIFYKMNKKRKGYNLYKSRDKIILYIGLPKREKGFFLFINACRKILENNFQVNILIIGVKDDRIKTYVEKTFEKWSDRIKILGWHPRTDLIYYYNMADLFINPSMDETWSMTTVEALSCGTPCICSNLPVFKYHINEYENGLLFKPNDIDDLASRIIEGLNIRWDRNRISKDALTKYSWEKSAGKLIKIYEKLIQNKGGSSN
ncbi:MAG: glycosyltransferase family 4 protein [Candidatus Helarchaeota archaeon]